MKNFKNKLLNLVFVVLTTASYGQNLVTKTTYYDPLTKTKVSETCTYKSNTQLKHGVYKSYDQSGNLTEETNYTDGQKNGSSKGYFGKKILVNAFYKMDKLDGNYESYFLSGNQTIKEKNVYVNGKQISGIKYFENGKMESSIKLDGLCMEWYDTGKKQAEYTLKNGKQNGVFTQYYSNGNIEKTGNYQAEKEIGLWKWYFESGKPQQEQVFDTQSKLINERAYYNSGQLKVEGWYNEQEILIKRKEYYTTGGLKIERYHLQDNLHKEVEYDSLSGKTSTERELVNYEENGKHLLLKQGKESTFWSNGNKKSLTNYSVTKGTDYRQSTSYKNGDYYDYYENNSIKWKGQYKDGYNVGTWILNYENGVKKVEQINIDQINSDYTSFYPSGKIESIGKLKSSKETGLWKFYKETGELNYVIFDENQARIKMSKAEYELKIENEKKAEELRKVEEEKKLDFETYSGQYQTNVNSINDKTRIIERLYKATNKSISNPIGLVPDINYSTATKEKLHDAYVILDADYLNKTNACITWKDKTEISSQRIKLLDKMIELRNADTKDLEKSLKKVIDPVVIKSLLNL